MRGQDFPCRRPNVRQVIVDCAHYVEGRRRPDGPRTIADAAACAERADGFVWLDLHEPTPEELTAAGTGFGLHELAIEDAGNAHQRPKLEDYEESYFVVLRSACYDDEAEECEFGEVHLFLGRGYAISVRHGAGSELSGARRRLEQRPELLGLGPAAVLWAVLDKVVDDYRPVASGLEQDIEAVEVEVFSGGDPTERIYFLRREVIDFHRAVHPLLAPLEALEQGGLRAQVDPQLRRFFRDVNDHVKRIDEEVASQRDLLTSVLEANMAVISVQQNEVVRKVSGWAAIVTVPTFIASFYGMNFEHMPELRWSLAYPAVITLMVVASVGLYAYFKRVRWL